MKGNNWGGRRENSGRKKTGKTVETISITLKSSEIKILKDMAAAEKLSVSRYISDKLKLAKIVSVMEDINDDKERS